MKAKDVPQEEWISGHGQKACYAEDASGRYVVVPCKGWEVEQIVNAQAHAEIDRRLEEVRREVAEGKASSLKYHMERNQMDVALLAGTSGFWKFQIKRHLKPKHFNGLELLSLEIYAKIFCISVEDLRKLPSRERNLS